MIYHPAGDAGARCSWAAGSLEPGRRADLVVLSEDVFACPDAEIERVRPVLTIIAGEVVFGLPEGL